MRRLIFTSAAVAVMALWAAEPISAAETRNGFSANGFSANGRVAGYTNRPDQDGVTGVVLPDGTIVEFLN